MALDISAITAGQQPQTNPITSALSNLSTIQDIRNKNAALPGIQADSAIKRRENAAQEWLQKNGKDYATVEDGKVKSMDYQGLARGLANAGFTDHAIAVAANDLANQAAVLQQGQTLATTAQTKALTDSVNLANAQIAQTLAVSTQGHVATLMHAYAQQNGINPAGPMTPANQALLDKEYTRLINGTQDQYKGALNVTAVFGQPDEPAPAQQGPNSPPVVRPTQGNPGGVYHFDPAQNEAFRTATMDPKTQQELQNATDTVRGALAGSGTSKQDLDPSSPQSKLLQTNAIKLLGDTLSDAQKTQISSMSAAQIRANYPSVGIATDAQVNPNGARVGAVATASTASNIANAYGTAANKLEAYQRTLTGNDLAEWQQSGPAAYFTSHASRLVGNKAFTDAQFAYNNAIGASGNQDEVNALTSTPAGGLAQAFRTRAGTYQTQAARAYGQATSPTVTGAANAATSPAPASPGTPVKMTKDGKSYTIPADKVEAAKKAGYTVAQ